MTTPVNSFQDILDALEQNPELKNQLRTHILTEELLQLPAQFLLLREGFSSLREGFNSLGEDFSSLREDFSSLRTDVDELKTRMNRVEGRLGNIEGNLYEQNAVRAVVQLASLELGIEAPRVAYSKFDTAHPNFNQALQEALQSGLISREQFRDLIQADLIVYGQNLHHAVVEISLGLNEDDISRALRRSEILQKATGEQVTPVIATPNPHAALIQEAEARNTRVLEIHA